MKLKILWTAIVIFTSSVGCLQHEAFDEHRPQGDDETTQTFTRESSAEEDFSVEETEEIEFGVSEVADWE